MNPYQLSRRLSGHFPSAYRASPDRRASCREPLGPRSTELSSANEIHDRPRGNCGVGRLPRRVYDARRMGPHRVDKRQVPERLPRGAASCPNVVTSKSRLCLRMNGTRGTRLVSPKTRDQSRKVVRLRRPEHEQGATIPQSACCLGAAPREIPSQVKPGS